MLKLPANVNFPLKATFTKHILEFYTPAKTSRNTLSTKTVYLLAISDRQGRTGIGECTTISKLSKDDCDEGFYEGKLREVTLALEEGHMPDLEDWPSIRFGLETALLDLQHGGRAMIFDTDFYKGTLSIPINGLVWMNDTKSMLEEAQKKVDMGFDCIKFKVGALDFDEECRMLESFRKYYPAGKCALRLDANGAFKPDEALAQLKDLSRFEVHSIEQPVKAGQWDVLEKLCAESKIPVALDEELIPLDPFSNGYELLAQTWPAYLVLKPSLLGGFTACDEWIRLAERAGVNWWITSALESNIGLNAIAQYTSRFDVKIPQGLGTGLLYKNNFGSPLEIEGARLKFNPKKAWQIG